jgi:hypothetical protein
VGSHHDAIARTQSPGDMAVVERGTLRSVVIRCPDGCGENITVNLDSRTGPAWKLYQSKRGRTLFPSVWKDSGCKSHFILWNDLIYWMDPFDSWPEETADALVIENKVLGQLNRELLMSFRDIAETINEIPWSVLASCQRLVSKGLAVRGSGKMRDHFKLI